jgi:hypothetical protein
MRRLLALALALASSEALAEALNTTTFGVGTRDVKLAPAKADGGSEQATADEQTLSEKQEGVVLCNRVSAPSSLFSVEIAAGGCMHIAKAGRSFANSIGGYGAILYYPFSARRRGDNDDLVLRLRLLSLSNFYILGAGGFSKITRSDPVTPVSYTIDTYDFGGGVGYAYRIFRYVSLGAEATYLYNSSLSSKVATGTATFTTASAVLTVYL